MEWMAQGEKIEEIYFGHDASIDGSMIALRSDYSTHGGER